MTIRKILYSLLTCAMLLSITACSNYTNYGERSANAPVRTNYERRISRRNITRGPVRPVTRGTLPPRVHSQPAPIPGPESITPQRVRPRHPGQNPPASRVMPHVAVENAHEIQATPQRNISQVAPHSNASHPTPVPVTSDAPGWNADPAANNPATSSSAAQQNSQSVSAKGELASHKTEFNAKEDSRNTNITRASNSINGHVVRPGETFSYNQTVGPTIERRGYKEGTIFVQGEKKKGFGGGVCQVSSTLSVAADEAGMTIIERHDHSRPVSYANEGEEAATSYGGIDFKFKNEKPFPIVIKSSVEDGTITVAICEG